METEKGIIKKSILILLLSFFYGTGISQIQFPFDSLVKVQKLLTVDENDENLYADIKPLEKENKEKEAERVLKRTFPAFKKYKINIGCLDSISYKLEASGSKYIISYFNGGERTFIHLKCNRKNSMTTKYITDDRFLSKIESALPNQNVIITFETVPMAPQFKTTYICGISGEGINLEARILNVELE